MVPAPMHGRVARWLAVLVLAHLLSGCGFHRRVSQCRRLSSHVNRALDDIAEVQDGGPAAPATYRDIADRYEKLGKELEGMAGSDPLGRAITEYAAVFRDTANTTRTLSQMMERNEAVAVARLTRELGNLGRREKTVVARIDAACHGP